MCRYCEGGWMDSLRPGDKVFVYCATKDTYRLRTVKRRFERDYSDFKANFRSENKNSKHNWYIALTNGQVFDIVGNKCKPGCSNNVYLVNAKDRDAQFSALCKRLRKELITVEVVESYALI